MIYFISSSLNPLNSSMKIKSRMLLNSGHSHFSGRRICSGYSDGSGHNQWRIQGAYPAMALHPLCQWSLVPPLPPIRRKRLSKNQRVHE